MSEAKVVVRHADKVLPTKFPWGEIRWLFHSHLASDAEMTLGVVTIRPGERNPQHGHSNCEELLYLIQGQLDHYVEDESFPLTAGAMIRLPRGTRHHAVHVGDEDAVMVVCYSAPVRQTRVHGDGGG